MSSEFILHMWPEADGLPSSSPYCLKVLYALNYKGIPYRTEYARKHLPEWVTTGKLPAAEIHGRRVEDSTTILKLIDGLSTASPRLYPKETERLIETNLLEEWADESLALQLVYHRWAIDSNFSKFLPQAFGPDPSERLYEAVRASREFHGHLFRDRGISTLTPSERLERFSEQLDIVGHKLGNTHFLTGTEPTAADFSVYAPVRVMMSAQIQELAPLIRQREIIVRWVEKMDHLCGLTPYP